MMLLFLLYASLFFLDPVGTPQRAPGDVRAEPGENGNRLCRHQRLHAAHDVPGHGRVSVHAGLGWSHELRGEDHSSVQVKVSGSAPASTHTNTASRVCVLLQRSLPSLLSKCSIDVPEARPSVLGSGEDHARSQSSREGLCVRNGGEARRA